jgi:predicted phosphate transport protein (TIGR00153 family)
MSRIPIPKIAQWLTQRRAEKTIKLVIQHIDRVIDTIGEFDLAIEGTKGGDKKSVTNALTRLSDHEVTADQLRRSISLELTKANFPFKTREDLMNLTKVIDFIADHVNDSGRNLKLLHNIELPIGFLMKIQEMVTILKMEAQDLKKAVMSLVSAKEDMLDHVEQVEAKEHEVDGVYFEIKAMLLNEEMNLSPISILILRDLLFNLEKASDYTEDAADVLRILIVSYS